MNTYSQLNNSFFEKPATIPSGEKNNLYFGVYELIFNKNNEYTNHIADGYTLFGTQTLPYFTYFPYENVRFDVGGFFHKDFGNKNFTNIEPIISLQLKLDSLSITMGTLNGKFGHDLPEPMYNFERILNNRIENGAQATYSGKNTTFDAWLSWEKMLYAGDSIQEEVWGGFSSKTKLFSKNNFSATLPIQFTAEHHGGQIDASPLPILTWFIGTSGFILNWKISEDKFLRNIRTENYLFLFKDFSFEYRDKFQQGTALYVNSTFETKHFDLTISYWQGDSYISSHGGLLYNSRSTSYKHADYVEKVRKILIIRFTQNIHIAGKLWLNMRFEPHYNFVTKTFEFSHGMYINLNQMFKIGNLKPYNF